MTVIAVTDTWGVEVGQPGVHWDKTYERGGDYVIQVTSKRGRWPRKAFTHVELFDDVDEKRRYDEYMKTSFHARPRAGHRRGTGSQP